MKLVVAIVQAEDAGGLVDALAQQGVRATRINTAGGFLKEANATILIGVEDDQVESALAVVQKNCRTRSQYINPVPTVLEPGEFYLPYPFEVQVGGATVFVLGVERFEKL